MGRLKKPLSIEKRHENAIKKLGYNPDEYYIKRGRKTLFRLAMIKEVRKLAGLGLVVEEIATFWGIGYSTLKRYMKNKRQFKAALKEGRVIADKNVEDSLYKRAIGFKTTELHYEIEYEQDAAGAVKAMKKLKKEIVKQIAGDTTAQIFWLKNRRPDKWRDDRGLSLFGPEGEPVSVQYIPASEYFKNKKQGGDGQKKAPEPAKIPPQGGKGPVVPQGSTGEGV